MGEKVEGEGTVKETEEEKSRCPWCEEILSLVEEGHQGSHGMMRIRRCARCSKLISVRLEGEPDRIIRKELISA